MATTATRLTVEEFWATPEREGVKQELIDGEVIEMATGGPLHEKVKSNFTVEFGYHFKHNHLPAAVFSETRYRLGEHFSPQPDVSIVLSGRLDPENTGKTTAVPEIVIEVVSSESAADLQKKIKEYLDHGVGAVWVAYPELSFVDVYKKEGVRRITGNDVLEDPERLPGWSVPVSTFFEGLR